MDLRTSIGARYVRLTKTGPAEIMKWVRVDVMFLERIVTSV